MNKKSTNSKKAPLMTHLRELKQRFVWVLLFFLAASLASYLFVEDIYALLVQPLADASGEEGRRLIYTGLTEAFFTYMRLSIYVGIVVSFPFAAIQFYLFIAPGLYKKERRVMVPFLVMTPILFFAGAYLAYAVIFPLAWQFFLGFETTDMAGMSVALEARVSEYLTLVMQLILAFGVAFLLPVFLMLLARVGFVRAEQLRKGRKYAIVALVTIAAVLTPPDIISQIGLAVPLFLLYEGSIWGCRLMEKRN